MPNILAFKKNKNNDEDIKFSDNNKKLINKLEKLTKLKKMFKSKKLSKSRNLFKFNTKKARLSLLIFDIKIIFNCL